MTLGEYIKKLESANHNKELAIGLGEPESWRGSYAELAFGVVSNTTIGEMLKHAKSAVGKTFTGYKGGEYEMSEETKIHVDEYGRWTDGGAIWELLLDLMTNE